MSIEFAMLAPAFLAASLMIGELGLYELYAGGLSYATQAAARQILLGNVANSSQPVNINNFINSYLCPSLPPLMDCSRVVVNSTVFSSAFLANGSAAWWGLMNAAQTGLQPPPAMSNTQTNFCIGKSGATQGTTSSVVALEVFYAMPFLEIPLMNAPTSKFNGSSVIWIASTAAFKNEPFTTQYAGC